MIWKWLSSWGYIGAGTIIIILFGVAWLTEGLEGLHPRAIFGVALSVWWIFRGLHNLRKNKEEYNGRNAVRS